MPEPRRVAIMLDLEWPYKRHTGVFVGTQRYAQEHGWKSLVDEYVAETLAAHPDEPAPYDGVIARATLKLARRAARRNVPLVNVWLSSPAWKTLPGVFSDYAAGGQLRAEHLLARGFRRFGALTNENDRAQQVELRAFLRTLAAAGCPCVTAKVALSHASSLKQWRTTERAIAAWMKDWQLPIGVYIGSEPDGRMVEQICYNRGWRVPEDVAIIAGRNEKTFCEHLHPTLTSIELDYERIGYEAARLLDGLMDGALPPATPLLLPPQGLVVRESTDFFAVDDTLIAQALAFIAANCHRSIGPDDVARAVVAETRTLRNHFRKHLDRSIAAEIRRVRIERAKRELAQTERSIGDIACDAGFGEAIQLYKVFVREVGVTPSEYRRQRQSRRTAGKTGAPK